MSASPGICWIYPTRARRTACSSARVTQQALADGVGTVREVVARILRDFREEGIVDTTPGHIRILDPARLAAIVGRDDAAEP